MANALKILTRYPLGVIRNVRLRTGYLTENKVIYFDTKRFFATLKPRIKDLG